MMMVVPAAHVHMVAWACGSMAAARQCNVVRVLTRCVCLDMSPHDQQTLISF
jgi:hypothetical protein